MRRGTRTTKKDTHVGYAPSDAMKHQGLEIAEHKKDAAARSKPKKMVKGLAGGGRGTSASGVQAKQKQTIGRPNHPGIIGRKMY